MPRPKILSDEDVLAVAHRLIHEVGPEALTFARLAEASALSASTLVQRFKSKAGLIQSTLLYAWDHLDAKTATLAAEMPRNPGGAVDLLVALSRSYGEIEDYANGLLVLREDIRDPVLRARGRTWKRSLSSALEACFADLPGTPPGIGLLLASHWQGSLLWWSFDPRGRVERFVEDSLLGFIDAVVPKRRK